MAAAPGRFVRPRRLPPSEAGVKDWHVLAASLAAFLGYYGAPAEDRPDLYYVACGVLLLTLALRLWPLVRSWSGHLACAICVVEAPQQALCGLVLWRQAATGEDLCRRVLGADLYAAAASVALAAVLAIGVRAWQR